MRKVDLTVKGQEQYEVIKAVCEGRMNKNRAAVQLNITKRQIYRLLEKYKQHGKAAFVHGNKGRKPHHALSAAKKAAIAALYLKKYFDANFAHAAELMAKHDNIFISSTELRKIMYDEGVLSPRAWKKTVKKLKKSLKERQKDAPKKEQKALESKIIAAENAHSRRPRAAHYGEIVQLDASQHLWFGDTKAFLHIAIDDNSGRIIAAYFDHEETLHGYYTLLYQILTTEGIPYKFLADRRTVFEYKRKNSPAAGDDVATQFGYACKLLGIEIATSSVPQAKGRVERAFQTLQSRLPVEFRLKGIADIKKANEALPKLIQDFNDSFSLPVDSKNSVFVEAPSLERIDKILSVLSERKLDKGQSIRYKNKFFRLLDKDGKQVNLRPGTKGLVAETFSGKLYFSVDNSAYVLDEIPARAEKSKHFDQSDTQKPPKAPYKPPKEHSWRNDDFSKFQKHIAAKFYLEV